MTKVEELRDRKQTDVEWHLCNVLGLLGLTNDDILPKIREELDSLISAAHAEGVAEGAEKERQRVRDEEDAESLRHDQECDRRAREKELGVDGLCDYIRKNRKDPLMYPLPPASVLAPTKESEK